jgi:hypothetical protein
MDFYFIYTNDDINDNDSNVNVKTGLNINKSKKIDYIFNILFFIIDNGLFYIN